MTNPLNFETDASPTPNLRFQGVATTRDPLMLNLRFLGVATTRDPLMLEQAGEPKVLRTPGDDQSAEVQREPGFKGNR